MTDESCDEYNIGFNHFSDFLLNTLTPQIFHLVFFKWASHVVREIVAVESLNCFGWDFRVKKDP